MPLRKLFNALKGSCRTAITELLSARSNSIVAAESSKKSSSSSEEAAELKRALVATKGGRSKQAVVAEHQLFTVDLPDGRDAFTVKTASSRKELWDLRTVPFIISGVGLDKSNQAAAIQSATDEF